jgi:precorrin-6B methylase 2
MRSLRVLAQAALAVALLAMAGAVALADDKKKDDDEKKEPDVVFVPTPQEVVEKMLELAKVTDKDVVYDLGCGDGRIVCTAARKYKCKALGIDIDPDRIKDSEATKKKLSADAQKLVTIKKGDIFKQDLSGASVITLYLLPDLNVKLVPQLKKLKAGSRIVSHAFDMKGYKPDKTITVKTKDDTEHTVYLWTIPLKPEKE